jgi:hypothetical protein
MQVWADSLGLSQRLRARLDVKINILAQAGDHLPPKLVQNTKSKHILEIAVNSRPLALRPMLCRGTSNMQDEFTFLFGATEKNSKYIPSDALRRANENRDDLIANPGNRCEHEAFNKPTDAGV